MEYFIISMGATLFNLNGILFRLTSKLPRNVDVEN
jgi:hypothetical protein